MPDLNSYSMSIYAQAVEQDRLFIQELIKTLTPEQIKQFCFENGFEVPEPQAIEMIKRNVGE